MEDALNQVADGAGKSWQHPDSASDEHARQQRFIDEHCKESSAKTGMKEYGNVARSSP
jgi:hypothetical protein